MTFSHQDIKQINSKGITVEDVMAQIETYKMGLPHINLKAAATLKDGVFAFSEQEKEHYISYFENQRNSKSIVKFVPASGAATRMFKFLFKFLKNYKPKKETINAYINRTEEADLMIFFVGLEKFPFYDNVVKQAKHFFPKYSTLSKDKQLVAFVKTMLDADKLNLSFQPKGLLPFHKYKSHVSSSFEEHLFEAALYASSNNKAHLHFTISEHYKSIFDKEFEHIKAVVERKTNTVFTIAFSYQKEATDTIALTPDNELFRESDGSLLFRPSGHGALLENLNDLDADIIFIKNIDNVVVYKFEHLVAEYKKLLAGILLERQEQIFNYLTILETDVLEEKLIEIAQFLTTKLSVYISPEFEKYSKKYQIAYLVEKLNRPLRVCGMVKNENEPGGGPFWVKHESGLESLQIVETAQIDLKNKSQKKILKNATHFNPVDIVCAIKDYKGNVFDLTKYIDPKTAFITQKTKTGKKLKALELPGLWNGSMANWNTILVEVPLETFNPVKTVNDLLKPKHQVS